MAIITTDKFKNVDLVIDHADDNTFIPKKFVSEGDRNGRTLTIQITNGGVVGEIPGATVNAIWTNQANGITDITAFDVASKADSVFVLTYPAHMLTAGKVKIAIQILYDGMSTITKQFEITVQYINGDFSALIDSQQYTALIAATAEANKFKSGLAQKVGRGENEAITTKMLSKELLEGMNKGKIDVNVNTSMIDDGAVSTSKLSNAYPLSQKDENALVGIATYADSYIDYTNGSLNIGKAANYTATDFIELDTKYNYLIEGTNQQFAFYGSDKKFLRGAKNASELASLNKNNVNYIRMTYETNKSDAVKLTKYAELSTKSIANQSLPISKLQDAVFLKSDKNLFDKTKITSGYYVDYTNGLLKKATGFNVSEPIKIDPRYKYLGENSTEQLAFYDATNVFCGGITRLENLAKTTIPEKADKMIITVRDSTLDTTRVSLTNDINVRDLSKSLQTKIDKHSGKYDYLIAKSGGDFSTIRSALEFNDSVGGGLTFKITKETFELTSEYTKDEYTASNFFGWSNRFPITLIGSSKTKTRLLCTLDDDLPAIHQARLSTFHPFASYEMSNLYIACTNGRYAIHNDNVGVRYATHTDLYCEKLGQKGYNQALGGGTWSNSIHTHKNCTFKTNFPYSTDISVSYHTNKNFSFSTKIIFENCTSISNSLYDARFGSLMSNADNLVELIGNRFKSILVYEETEALGTGYDFLFSGYGNKPLTFNLKSRDGIATIAADFVEDVTFKVV